MAVTSKQAGTQNVVIGTEHALGAAITTAGVYVLVVDTGNLANGDVIEIRARTKARGISVSRVAYTAGYANAQSEPNKYSVPIPVDSEVAFTLKQTSGAARAFDWSVLAL